MYFKSRVDAGQQLANQIIKRYGGVDCAIVALSDGGVMVGAQIALELHCVLTLLLAETINLPRETAALAGINQDGSFSYNHQYSQGELDDLVGEYHGFIEQEKMNKMQELHRAMGQGTLIRKDLLSERVVILVSDGLSDGFALEVALQYLKTIHTKRIVIATPLASVPAVDRMHVLGDEIFCLSVIEDYISTEHYYETQDVPSHEKVVQTVEHIVANWKTA